MNSPQTHLRAWLSIIIAAFFVLRHVVAAQIVLQPGPGEGKDIWTTSVYSYAPGGSFPGGGKDDHELVVGGWGDSYYSLIEFNLNGLPSVATSARLELFCFTQRGFGTTPLFLDRITTFWDWRIQGTGRDRERLWWADRPTATPWISSALPAPVVGQWYSIDLTDLYNAWQANTYPNYGIQLRPFSTGNVWAEFYSSDYLGDPSLRPKLIVQSTSAESVAEKAVALAKSVVGGKYDFGAKGWDVRNGGFVQPQAIRSTGYYWSFNDHSLFANVLDCSGLSLWAYNKAYGSKTFPSPSEEVPEGDDHPIYFQGADGQYRNNTVDVDEADLQPGDFLFFDARRNDVPIDHMAMYVGCCDPNGNDVVEARGDRGIIWSKKDEIKRTIPGFVGFGRLTKPKKGVRFMTHSPVDLIVTDPDGFTITPQTLIVTDNEILREIPGVLYYWVSALEPDGSPQTVVCAPEIKTGVYVINVMPRENVAPTATYSLQLNVFNQKIMLAQDALLSEIPNFGYGVNISSETVSEVIPVAIQIKMQTTAPLNLGSKGVTPIAIFSANGFAATDIDLFSIRVGHQQAAFQEFKSQLVDLNRDGLLDLLIHFPTRALFVETTGKATLFGKLLTGEDFYGQTTIRFVP